MWVNVTPYSNKEYLNAGKCVVLCLLYNVVVMDITALHFLSGRYHITYLEIITYASNMGFTCFLPDCNAKFPLFANTSRVVLNFYTFQQMIF